MSSTQPLSRLDQLKALRARLDVEIERETRFQQRIRRIGTASHVAINSRGDWSARVIQAAAQWYGVTAANITSPTRRPTPTTARAVAAYLLRHSGRSYPEVGRLLNRDHTTIISSVRRVAADPNLLTIAQHIERELLGQEAS